MAACRDECVSNAACTGYQWITDPSVTDDNCAAFTETNPVAGDGTEGFECYAILTDADIPAIAEQIYVADTGSCQIVDSG